MVSYIYDIKLPIRNAGRAPDRNRTQHMNLSDTEFVRSVSEFAVECRKNGRLATLSGYLWLNRLTTAEYAAFCAAHPEAADMARSLFIDEAVNFKAVNSAATIRCVLSVADGVEGEEEIDVDLSEGE